MTVCACLAAAAACGYALRVSDAGDAGPIHTPERINPNTAPVGSLVRLPGIGPTRARAIAAYRETIRQTVGDGPVFRSCDDLQQIKGIGPKTAEDVRDWLEFQSAVPEAETAPRADSPARPTL
ncbi:MAG TPA: helix-hairpin-helix domain-containing protein [Chromatiales bacterium]|nr:helix-hairpin-helix domain-containing protein [Chromatiales bacterium]